MSISVGEQRTELYHFDISLNVCNIHHMGTKVAQKKTPAVGETCGRLSCDLCYGDYATDEIDEMAKASVSVGDRARITLSSFPTLIGPRTTVIASRSAAG